MKPVIVYTVHKAGSSFLNRLIRQTCRRLKIEHCSENDDRYHERIFNSSWKTIIEDSKDIGCFGPVRGSTRLPIFPDNLNDYSVVLHLRDPRDVLTSMYFSFSYSHTIRPGRFEATEQQRENWRNQGIDKFVLDAAPRVCATYTKLCSQLLVNPNVSLLLYEDMVLNYGSWLSGFLSAFEHMNVPARKVGYFLLSQNARRKKIHRDLFDRHKDDFQVDREDIYSHKRKVVPGDHKDKLAESTVDQLNEIFADYFDVIRPLTQKSAAG